MQHREKAASIGEPESEFPEAPDGATAPTQPTEASAEVDAPLTVDPGRLLWEPSEGDDEDEDAPRSSKGIWLLAAVVLLAGAGYGAWELKLIPRSLLDGVLPASPSVEASQPAALDSSASEAAAEAAAASASAAEAAASASAAEAAASASALASASASASASADASASSTATAIPAPPPRAQPRPRKRGSKSKPRHSTKDLQTPDL